MQIENLTDKKDSKCRPWIIHELQSWRSILVRNGKRNFCGKKEMIFGCRKKITDLVHNARKKSMLDNWLLEQFEQWDELSQMLTNIFIADSQLPAACFASSTAGKRFNDFFAQFVVCA